MEIQGQRFPLLLFPAIAKFIFFLISGASKKFLKLKREAGFAGEAIVMVGEYVGPEAYIIAMLNSVSSDVVSPAVIGLLASHMPANLVRMSGDCNNFLYDIAQEEIDAVLSHSRLELTWDHFTG